MSDTEQLTMYRRFINHERQRKPNESRKAFKLRMRELDRMVNRPPGEVPELAERFKAWRFCEQGRFDKAAEILSALKVAKAELKKPFSYKDRKALKEEAKRLKQQMKDAGLEGLL